MLPLIIFVLTELGQWRYFQKMGREGWEGIIPAYNMYILFEELYENGWKFLLLLVPFYNIYILIKLNLDLAHAFNKSIGFAIGLILLPFIFTLLLAFGDAVYQDGTSAKVSNDALSRGLDTVSSKFSGSESPQTEPDKVTDKKPDKAPDKEPDVVQKLNPTAVQKLKDLDELHKDGLLTDEEFEEKRSDVVKHI